MRLSSVAALAIVASARVASAQSQAEHVLVPRSAALHVEAREGAASARDPWAGRYDLRLGPYWAHRLVADRGAWIEIEAGGGEERERHCYGAPSGLRGLPLRLFVRRSDVAHVVARTVRRSFRDGTSVALRAGVGLERARERGRWLAVVDGARLEVTLADEDVSTRYVPEEAFEARWGPSVLAWSARLRVDGRPALSVEPDPPRPRSRLERQAALLRSVLASSGDDDTPRRRAVPIVEARAIGGGLLATARTRCLEVVGRATRRDLTNDPGPAGIGALTSSSAASVPQGVVATWPDGREAGRTVAFVALEHEAAPAADGRRCYDVPLRDRIDEPARPEPDGTLRLCFAATDVRAPRGIGVGPRALESLQSGTRTR